MTVRVLFFGATADAVGERASSVHVPDNTPAAAVVDQVVASHPTLARHKLLFAVNEEYVPTDTIVRDGDELAIFTAVSGG
ncbi:MAG TPA: MoaD/ThiS family protein [Pyrinomonadaceae bacterium]|nr:MoaD/ThiS family protein [Pyrinomonadaceae bacterium]